MSVRSDLERIDEWWEQSFERDGALGFSLFASSADALWRELPLAAVVADEAGLGARLRLRPLVELAGDDHEGALVSVVNRERSRVLRLHAGRLDEIGQRSEERIGALHGGHARPGYDHHLESLAHRHLKAVARDLDTTVHGSEARPELVVVGPEELRGELELSLPPEVRRAIVGWTHAKDDATPSELLDAVRPVLAEARQRRRAACVDRWRVARASDGLATAGWEETLAASAAGRTELLLILRTAQRSAFSCPRCELPAVSAGLCPLHGLRLVPDDGVERAIHDTVAFGGIVELIDGNELDPAHGIGALLRF
ncbi:MAG: baeRF10 domain-containing protein [Gaiellaceae bacterium]